MGLFRKVKRLFKGIFQSAVARLWERVKEKYPDLVEEIKLGIAMYNSPEFDAMNGGEKGVEVAKRIISLIPDIAPILANLPDLKSFIVRGVADIYASEFKPALEREAGKLIGKL